MPGSVPIGTVLAPAPARDPLPRCYRAQSFATAAALARELGLSEGDWSVSFQSRLGRAQWLGPYTEDVLAGMPAATVDTALLLTSEVVTNATAHGGGLVTLTVDLDGEGLRVEVCDESPRRPVPREESLLAEGGRGLHIVDALAADWGARPDKRGKKVWFRLPVPGRRGVR